MKDLIAALSTLETTAKKLNAASDELNEIIAMLEARLVKMGIGVTVWLDDDEISVARIVEYDDDEDDDVEDEREPLGWRLGYARHGREWRLKAVDGHGVEMPLCNAPRHIRLGALPLFPKLLQELNTRAQTHLAQLAAAKALVGK